MEKAKQVNAEPKYAFNFMARCLRACCAEDGTHHAPADVLSKRNLEEMFEIAHRDEKPTRIFNSRLLGHGVNGKPNGPYKTPQCFSPDDILKAAEGQWPDEFTKDVIKRLKSQKAEVRNNKRKSRDAIGDGGGGQPAAAAAAGGGGGGGGVAPGAGRGESGGGRGSDADAACAAGHALHALSLGASAGVESPVVVAAAPAAAGAAGAAGATEALLAETAGGGGSPPAAAAAGPVAAEAEISIQIRGFRLKFRAKFEDGDKGTYPTGTSSTSWPGREEAHPPQSR